MKFSVRFFCSVCSFVTFSIINVSAQTLKEGEKALNEGRYEEARVLLEKAKEVKAKVLLGHTYTLLGKYSQAETILKPLAKQRNLLATYYYGILCQKLYRFEESVKHFDYYLSMTKDGNMKKKVSILKEQCQRAAKMLENTKEVEIIDSMVAEKNNFVEKLKLSKENGTLYPFNSFFQGLKDWSSVYETLKKDRILYGKLSASGNDYDLYSQTKLVDKYGDERAFSEKTINSEYNENFPFLCSDGLTIYYSTDNPKRSIGGYDIVITRYHYENSSYLMPENMGMPFNSIANDYMLVLDDANEVGWFVSDRNQPKDKVCIYLFCAKAKYPKVKETNNAKKLALAQIKGIQNTWKKRNYNDLLSKVYAEKKEEVKDQTIYFPISNRVVYYSEKDFQSPQAQALFKHSVALSDSIDKVEKELTSIRTKYEKSLKSFKESEKNKILLLEDSLFSLKERMQTLLKECRNEEIKRIRK